MGPVPIEYRTYTFFSYSRQSPIGSISFGGFHADGKGVPAMRALDMYAVIYVVRGQARYADANGQTASLAAGDLLLLFPGVAHTYTPRGDEPWSEIWFTFDGPVFDVWREKGLLDPARPVRQLLPIDYWHRRFEYLLETGQRLSGRNAVEQACAPRYLLRSSRTATSPHCLSREIQMFWKNGVEWPGSYQLPGIPSRKVISFKSVLNAERCTHLPAPLAYIMLTPLL